MASVEPIPYPSPTESVFTNDWRPSAWSLSFGKRALDIVLALSALICLLPVMLVVAIAVRLTSSGPALFRHLRCGQNGHRFEVLKFRTMVKTSSGPNVTRSGDSRITPLGRILRKWKIDEFPQLINVIRGEMSMVGPRPDTPEYFDAATQDVREVLKLRPGITGWASIHFRNEEELLAQVPADRLHDFYVKTILPRKARLDLEYAARATLCTDLTLMLLTAAAILPNRSRQK